MTRAQLEHVIRAAATIASDPDIVIIGSQAILGQFPDAPPELLVSNEAEVYPRTYLERSDLIDGSIGELSPFHETYGYYAQGIGRHTAVVPEGWEDRLVPIPTSAGTGWCLEVHDLVISKYVAGREKDQRLCAGCIEAWARRPTDATRPARFYPADDSAARAAGAPDRGGLPPARPSLNPLRRFTLSIHRT